MHQKAGFFFIEILIILALLIIILTLALPNMHFLKKQIVRSEVEKLATTCLFLRQCALVTHQEQVLVFNTNTGQYTSGNYVYALAAGVKFGFLAHMYGPPSSPHAPVTQPITFKNNKIHFYTNGTISSGILYVLDASNTYGYALTIGSGQAPFIRKYEFQQQWVLLS